VTSALPFLVHPSEPPATDLHHQKFLVVLTRFRRILGTSVPECVGLLRIWDRLGQLLLLQSLLVRLQRLISLNLLFALTRDYALHAVLYVPRAAAAGAAIREVRIR